MRSLNVNLSFYLGLLFSIVAFVLVSGCSNPPAEYQASKQHQFTESYVLAGALSADAKLTAVFSLDKKLTLWRNQDYAEVASWTLPSADTAILAFSADQRTLVLASNSTLYLFDIESGSKRVIWTTTNMLDGVRIIAVAVNSAATKVVAGLNQGGTAVIDLAKEKAYLVRHHQGSVIKLTFVDDGQRVIAGALDGSVTLWDASSGLLHQTIELAHRITSLVEEKGKVFVSDALDGQWIIDLEKGTYLTQFKYDDRWRWFRLGIFLDQGRYLATSSPKSEISLWDSQTGKEISRWQIQAVRSGATAVAMSKTSYGELVTLSSDAILQYWSRTD